MKIKIVDRKYRINNLSFRFSKMRGVKLIGYKISIFRYEIRFYFGKKK